MLGFRLIAAAATQTFCDGNTGKEVCEEVLPNRRLQRKEKNGVITRDLIMLAKKKRRFWVQPLLQSIRKRFLVPQTRVKIWLTLDVF